MTNATTPRPEDQGTHEEPLRDVPGLSEADEAQLRGNLAELVMIQGNIQGKDNNVRTIYVTSCFNGEGKTRAVMNMGHGMSINHSRILLIDGNPRAPQLHKKYGVPSAPGLMDVLFLGTSTEDAIHETRYRDLHVMPFGQGPPGRPNMLKDNILRDWLDRMKDSYDFIIMDGHSQIGSSDGPLVASIFDGTVLVVECEKTKWEVLQDASKKIALLGGKPLGIVLNKRKFYIPRIFYGRK
ncbi:putative ATPase [Desulfovibrio ferrophilus]|uniref:non-specific protein-tyrosine kinase n=2 Tax=Desulfovibrio ferrophilus TaxID=241368 RepID=A0A2Z6B165_9BACT|nr:putative ATPase [Desulfovibrio ferrophilus]